MEWAKPLVEAIKELWPVTKIGVLFVSLYVTVSQYFGWPFTDRFNEDILIIFNLLLVFMIGVYVFEIYLILRPKSIRAYEDMTNKQKYKILTIKERQYLINFGYSKTQYLDSTDHVVEKLEYLNLIKNISTSIMGGNDYRTYRIDPGIHELIVEEFYEDN